MQLNRTLKALMVLAAVSVSCITSAGELIHEVTIEAPVADVWNAFTDAKEIETWMVPKADIDLRVGGLLRTAYDARAELDGPQAIHHQILAYEPQRMLALKVVQCPDGFEFAEQVEQTWEVLYFEPVSADRTHIRAVGLGYGEGEQWERMRTFFDQGNAWTYAQLQKKFDKDAGRGGEPSNDPLAALELLGRLVGGEWIHEGEGPDGGTFRVRNVVQSGPDGSSVIARGWIGSTQGMHEHAATLAYFDPVAKRIRFVNVNERGDVAEGTITSVNETTLHWDWHVRGQPGALYDVRMEFTGDDAYTFTLSEVSPDGSKQQLVEAGFDRVEQAPAGFRADAADHRDVNSR